MLKERKVQIVAAVFIIAIFLAGFVGSVIGATYPNWANNLSFLPAFLKPKEAVVKEVTQGGQKVVRTVEESAVIDVVDKSSPAVVSIVAKTAELDPLRGRPNGHAPGGCVVRPGQAVGFR